MPHMVIYRSAEGKPGYHQADALDEAVRFVEQLRNAEGVEGARIFSMHEVEIEIKTYYRVEVSGGAQPPSAPRTSRPVAAVTAGADPVPVAPAPSAQVAPSGRGVPAGLAALTAAGPGADGQGVHPASGAVHGAGGRFGLFNQA